MPKLEVTTLRGTLALKFVDMVRQLEVVLLSQDITSLELDIQHLKPMRENFFVAKLKHAIRKRRVTGEKETFNHQMKDKEVRIEPTTTQT